MDGSAVSCKAPGGAVKPEADSCEWWPNTGCFTVWALAHAQLGNNWGISRCIRDWIGEVIGESLSNWIAGFNIKCKCNILHSNQMRLAHGYLAGRNAKVRLVTPFRLTRIL